MMTDTDVIILECPQCNNSFEVTVYDGEQLGKVYGLDNATLAVISEIHHESREGRIQCIHCGLSIAVNVVYAAKLRALSDCIREGWVMV